MIRIMMVFVMLFNISCGDDPVSMSPSKLFKATLIDSPIEGVTYFCDGNEYVTDPKGLVSCHSFPIIFKIGAIEIGSIEKSGFDLFITPHDLLGLARSEMNDKDLLRLIKLLQSLDDDGVYTSGIKIKDSHFQELRKPQYRKKIKEFSDAEILGIYSRLSVTPVGDEEAIRHLSDSLMSRIGGCIIYSNKEIQTDENTPVSVTLGYGYNKSLSLESPSSGAAIIGVDSDKVVSGYTPSFGFTGVDSYNYTIGNCTKKITVTVNPVTCTDGVKNGAESDIDCGGSCASCEAGSSCGMGPDCTSFVCNSNECQSPTCTDGIVNGTETGVDCGGSCNSCAPVMCFLGNDCTSGVCDQGICQAPHCTDSVQNGDETDVDCGGECFDCGTGNSCLTNQDCSSGSCIINHCQAPTCTDSIKNGAESDVDCGGTCPDCGTGNSCLVNQDCSSGACIMNHCQNPTCFDGTLNGSETGVDCGGSCQSCGAVCGNNIAEVTEECDGSDMGEFTCLGLGFVGGTLSCKTECQFDTSQCQAAVCGNNIRELEEQCDGTDFFMSTCSSLGFNAGDLACNNGTCEFDTSGCNSSSCVDGVKNGAETDIDCGGNCPSCFTGNTCNFASDCSSQVCEDSHCVAPSCSDGIQNGTETDVDCGGSCQSCGAVCGNDTAEMPEECDGTDLFGFTCVDFGYVAGTLSCTDSCYLSTIGCEASYCGNGIVDPGEDCDGPVMDRTCEELGYEGGILSCSSQCDFDDSECVVPF